jgi:arylsulfatase A-like enzyme
VGCQERGAAEFGSGLFLNFLFGFFRIAMVYFFSVLVLKPEVRFMKKKVVTRIVSGLLLGGTAVVAADRPNILFILTDDQGYGDVGRHGHPLLKTPNIDALYDQSVRFEKFYVSPSCSPSRAAIMTGMHEFKNGVTHTTSPREHLNKDAVLLPQLLKTAGYRTGFIGKWHLGNDGVYAPGKRGFDWCSTNQGGPNSHFDPVFVRNGKRTKEKGYREDIFFNDAMTFIDESGEAPFFCYLATYSPHAPLAAPEEFVAPFRGKVDDEEAAFLGMVANLDYNVGRLMDYLREKKLDEKTMVLFMNDNGETHGLDVYNAGMRGNKCTIWQGGSRAMSFWRWRGHWTPHEVQNLTAHLDVLPTLCDLAGVDLPADLRPKLDGYSLRPLLESTKPQAFHDDRLLFHHVGRWPSGMAAAHKYAMASVQTGDYLLVRSQPCDDPECEKYVSQCTTLRSVENGAVRATYTKENAQFHWGVTPRDHWSLFNLKDDPSCEKDLSAKLPELTDRLAVAYDNWWDTLFPAMIAYGGDLGEPQLRKKSGPVEN